MSYFTRAQKKVERLLIMDCKESDARSLRGGGGELGF
jgi:hypothetical protein